MWWLLVKYHSDVIWGFIVSIAIKTTFTYIWVHPEYLYLIYNLSTTTHLIVQFRFHEDRYSYFIVNNFKAGQLNLKGSVRKNELNWIESYQSFFIWCLSKENIVIKTHTLHTVKIWKLFSLTQLELYFYNIFWTQFM